MRERKDFETGRKKMREEEMKKIGRREKVDGRNMLCLKKRKRD